MKRDDDMAYNKKHLLHDYFYTKMHVPITFYSHMHYQILLLPINNIMNKNALGTQMPQVCELVIVNKDINRMFLRVFLHITYVYVFRVRSYVEEYVVYFGWVTFNVLLV